MIIIKSRGGEWLATIYTDKNIEVAFDEDKVDVEV